MICLRTRLYYYIACTQTNTHTMLYNSFLAKKMEIVCPPPTVCSIVILFMFCYFSVQFCFEIKLIAGRTILREKTTTNTYKNSFQVNVFWRSISIYFFFTSFFFPDKLSQILFRLVEGFQIASDGCSAPGTILFFR